MSDLQAVQVFILEQSYTLTCPTGKEASLRNAAASLDQKLRDIKAGGRVLGLERMAVMAALNMSAELLDCQAQLDTLEKALQQLNQKIMAQLD